MTSEQINKELEKLRGYISFHVQDVELRSLMLDFLNQPTVQPRLIQAPASSQHHQAFAGGLLSHTNEVIAEGLSLLLSWVKAYGLTNSERLIEDFVVAATLHDISKIGDPLGRIFYCSNTLKSGKVSDKKPFKRTDTAFRFAGITKAAAVDTGGVKTLVPAIGEFFDRNVEAIREGELSLLLVNSISPILYTRLNSSVKFAVRFHDGAYAGNRFEMGGKETPVHLALHTADMVSSRKNRWLNPSVFDEETSD